MKFLAKISEREITQKIELLDYLKYQLLFIDNEDVIKSYQNTIDKMQKQLKNIYLEV